VGWAVGKAPVLVCYAPGIVVLGYVCSMGLAGQQLRGRSRRCNCSTGTRWCVGAVGLAQQQVVEYGMHGLDGL
jgi:hypothetical protein